MQVLGSMHFAQNATIPHGEEYACLLLGDFKLPGHLPLQRDEDDTDIIDQVCRCFEPLQTFVLSIRIGVYSQSATNNAARMQVKLRFGQPLTIFHCTISSSNLAP
jgi:hypothetical protein